VPNYVFVGINQPKQTVSHPRGKSVSLLRPSELQIPYTLRRYSFYTNVSVGRHLSGTGGTVSSIPFGAVRLPLPAFPKGQVV
jgi:hypothetical protein